MKNLLSSKIQNIILYCFLYSIYHCSSLGSFSCKSRLKKVAIFVVVCWKMNSCGHQPISAGVFGFVEFFPL